VASSSAGCGGSFLLKAFNVFALLVNLVYCLIVVANCNYGKVVMAREYIIKTVPCDCHEGCTKRKQSGSAPKAHGKSMPASLHGCRCEQCVKVPCNCNPNCTRLKSKNPVVHGTSYTYQKIKGHGCRCEVCVNYIRGLRNSRYHEEREVKGLPPIPKGERGLVPCDCHEGCTKFKLRGRKNAPKHGMVLYKEHDCRCEVCVRSMQLCNCNPNCKVGRPFKEVKHGNRTIYEHHKCRCDKCREANKNYNIKNKIERIEKIDKVIDSLNHGSSATYLNWNCRCEPCTEANSLKCKIYSFKTGKTKNPSWDVLINMD